VRQSSYSWTIQHSAIPLPGSNGSVGLAFIDVISNRTTALTLRFNNLTGIVAEELGFSVVNHMIVMNATLLNNLNSLSFPLSGVVIATDDRTSCKDLGNSNPGPCSIEIPFVLNIAELYPSCPQDIFLFSPTNTTTVSWAEPQLRSRNGTLSVISGSVSSGSAFAQGDTTVVYSPLQDPSQNPATHIQCSFKVCCEFFDCTGTNGVTPSY
jgi:hypothetical protein